ncbi:MAG: hypothetical protein JWO03_781 [Bacteroidetes bacterium]|nr:hypothetical protein [Bacteroidota bacterium]
MKTLLPILFAVLFCWQTDMHAQGLTPSTVRQVFDLQGGDSLQYHIWTTAQICQTICNVYKWYVIDTVLPATTGDSLTVWFHATEIHMDTPGLTGAPCAPACYHDIEVDLPGNSAVRTFRWHTQTRLLTLLHPGGTMRSRAIAWYLTRVSMEATSNM